MKIKRIIFLSIIFVNVIMLSGYSLIKQNKFNISQLEKRELSYIKPLSVNNWITKEFQASVDNSMIDNFWRRNDWLKYYNRMNLKSNDLGFQFILMFFKDKLNKKISLQNVNEKISYIKDISCLIRNPYIYDPIVEDEIKNNIDKMNILVDKYSDVEFYIYLLLMANETEIINEDLNKEYLSIFQNSKALVKKFEIKNIYELEKTYFRTDHHWTHIGAYKGYTDIIKFLFGDDENPKSPIKEEIFKEVSFFGSHSRAIAHSVDIEGDKIGKYIFELPKYELKIDGQSVAEYGHYSNYVEGNIDYSKDFDHYNWLYQKREGEIIFDTNQKNLDNILIISDSMSNAIRDVLASHFNKTIFINLDQYQRNIGDFKIEEYINKYKVDKVLTMVVLRNYFPDGELKYLKIE